MAIPDVGVFAVCDGCGGKAGGKRASAIASRIIADEGKRLVETFSDYRTTQDAELRQQILQQIARIIDQASGEIYHEGQVNEEFSGMATTSIMLTFMDNSGFIGHVGDSRIYLVRRDKIYQLTEDHSFFQKLVNEGKLRVEDYDTFPYKHIISRSVGTEPTVQTDTLFVDLLPTDIYILVSDGISDVVKPVEILSIAHYDGPERLADRLIELTLERGAPDNASAVVVEVLAADDDETQTIDFTTRMQILGQIELFRLLSDQELARVLRIVYEESFSTGDVIIREGEVGDCIYLVGFGEVSVMLNGVELTCIGPGGHLGELSLVDEAPRSASAFAKSDVTVLRISKDDFFRLTHEDPLLANKLLWVFLESAAKRVRELSGRVSGAQ